jgi:glycerophosphoryl diester phosphodiesterase
LYTQLPRPTIFAHRGASNSAPENTIAAFRLAISQKADAIELDAKCTSDGQIVIIHDQTVDRTTNGTGKVGELPLVAINELDAGGWFHSEYSGEAIPTLDEVFETLGSQIFINIELTNYASPTDHLPQKVVQIILHHGLENQVLLSSFNPLALRRAHSFAPQIPLGLLSLPGFQGIWARSFLGNFVPHQAFHPHVNDANTGFIEKFHRKEKRVHVWTVNSAEDMQRLFHAGVDGIFTDDVPTARNILSNPSLPNMIN